MSTWDDDDYATEVDSPYAVVADAMSAVWPTQQRSPLQWAADVHAFALSGCAVAELLAAVPRLRATWTHGWPPPPAELIGAAKRVRPREHEPFPALEAAPVPVEVQRAELAAVRAALHEKASS